MKQKRHEHMGDAEYPDRFHRNEDTKLQPGAANHQQVC